MSSGVTIGTRGPCKLFIRPTWPADQPAHLVITRQPGGPVRPWLSLTPLLTQCILFRMWS